MNKKKILGIVTAIMVTALSTSAIAFASQASSSSTKDVVKMVATKTKDTSSGNTKANISNGSTVNPASVDKFLDISNEQAIQTAKQAIKSMFGVDTDEARLTKVEVYRPGDGSNKDSKISAMKAYHMLGGNPSIYVEFVEPNPESAEYVWNNAEVQISLLDGKVRAGKCYNKLDVRLNSKAQYDDNKLKTTAEQFLKDKNFDTNYKSVKTGGPGTCKALPVTDVYFDYPDGTTIRETIDIVNYKVCEYEKYKTPVKQN